MSKETKYLVLSIGQIRELLKSAQLIDAKHGMPPHKRNSCVVVGLSISENHPRQANLESIRAVASDYHYHPMICEQTEGQIIGYTGPHTTGSPA